MEIRLTTEKSRRSGDLWEADGQQLGYSFEKCLELFWFITVKSPFPLALSPRRYFVSYEVEYIFFIVYCSKLINNDEVYKIFNLYLYA